MKFDFTRRPVKEHRGSDVQRFSVLLCGSLLIGGAQVAEAANNRESFRDFRDSHSHLERRDARQLFRTTYNGRSAVGASLPVPITPKAVETNKNNWQNTNFNINVRNPLTNKEAKLLRVGAQDIGTKMVRLNSGIDLDLSSADRNIILGENLFKSAGSVEITVGTEQQTFSAGSKATAAEYVAIKQALSTNVGQKLVIDQSGIASGGSLDLTEITGSNDPLKASSLTVSSGVTTYGDFGKKSDFRLTGDLNNYGTVIALSSTNSGRAGAIRADDITNNVGAAITSILPDSLANSHLARKVDLTLDAKGDLTNFGTLSSSGNLSLIAGDSINNKGSISASDSVNMTAPNINNSSEITASAGNINIDGPSIAALNVNNSQGTLSAINGAINVRTPDYTGTFNNNISGGDLFSKEVNINGGNATNNVNVNELTGTVSQTGLAAHVTAATQNLILGSNCLTGDPTFFNKGDITITGDLIVSEALTLIAEGDITSVSGVSIAARSATSGFDITMIAGATITSGVGGNPTVPPGTGASVTIDGTVSGTGGSIALGTGTSIVSSPLTGGSGDGGNVFLYAFQNGAARGRIDVNDTTIMTGGIGAGENGNVVIVGGGNNPGIFSAIQIGQIDTTGGTGGGGDLTIITAQPIAVGGPVTYDAEGKLSGSGQLAAGAVINPAASIGQAGGKAIVAGNVIMNAGKNIIQQSDADTLVTTNFNAQIQLIAGEDVGAGFSNEFIIEGFNELFTKKVLKRNNFDSGNSALTVTSGGSVNILRNASTNLTLEASSSKDEFALRTNSALTVGDNLTSTAGLVRLENTGGSLTIDSGKAITAFDVIDITNGTTKKLKPLFTVGANATITTTQLGGPTFNGVYLTLDSTAFEINSVGVANAGRNTNPSVTDKASIIIPITSLDYEFALGVGTSPDLAGAGGAKKMEFLGPANIFESNNTKIEIVSAGKKGAMSFGGGVVVTAGQP